MWRTENDQFTPGINPRLSGFRRNKNNSYEMFNGVLPPPPAARAACCLSTPPRHMSAPRSSCARVRTVAFSGAATVALFAPAATLALARPESAGAPPEALPMVMIMAGMTGEVKIFENTGVPLKL